MEAKLHAASRAGQYLEQQPTGRVVPNAELTKLTLTHTPGEIAKAMGKIIRTIYQELKRYGIQAQQNI